MRSALILLLLAAAPLSAQLPDSTVRDTSAARLPTVEVIGSILAPTGPRIGSGVPARVTVVEGERVDAWEPRLLSDALAANAGISLYDDLGSRLKTTLVSRGFTSSPVVGLPQGVSVFVDGVPVNEPDAGQVNFDLLPLEHIRRVELLSGTASLLGPHSLGGAVNLVTRRGAGALGAELELSRGSHEAWATEGTVSGESRGWSYYGGAGWADERGWRQLTGAEQLDGIVNLARVRDRGGFSIQAFGATSRAETAGSLPESVFESRPDSNLTSGDFEDLRQLHIAAFGWRELNRGRVSLGLWLRAHDAERFNVNQATDPDVRSFSENRTLGANFEWRSTWPVGRSFVGVRIGATGTLSRTSIRIFAERIDPGLTTHVESPIGDAGGHALAEWVLGNIVLSAGTRVDVVRIPFRNRIDAARDTTSTYTQASPRAGIAWTITPRLRAYASLGRSFRAPAVIELACADPQEPCPLPFALGDDPPLDPVTATTGEVGAEWNRDPIGVSASVFRTEVRDEIFLFPYDDASEPEGSTIDGFFANVSRTRREGIETVAQLRPRDWAELRASWSWTRATFRTGGIELFSIREEAGGANEVERGDRLPLIPEHTVKLGADLVFPRGITAGVDTRWIGRQWLRGDEANEESRLAAYTTTDVRVGVALGSWALHAIARNVFDSRHATFGTFNIHQAAGGVVERFLTPGEPRTVLVVVRREIGG